MGGRGASSSIGRGSGAGKPNEATEYYVSGDGMYINNFLREGRELDAQDKQLIKDLDLATNGSVKQDDLYRSVDAKAIFGDMDWIDYDNLDNYLRNGEKGFDKGSYSQSQLNKVKNIINKTQGKTITEKGYMSTSKDESVASDWGGFSGSEMPVVMHLKNTKGAKGVDVSIYDKNTSSPQKEVLLGRNQQYKIDNISMKNGQIYIDATLKK